MRIPILAAAAALTASLLISPGGSASALDAPGQVWIGGTPTAGHTWQAKASGWMLAPSFIWLVDGQPVASGPTWVAPANTMNHFVQVRATAGLVTSTTPRLRVQSANPLAGQAWIPPTGPDNERWMGTAFTSAISPLLSTAGEIAQLNKIANRPRVIWLPGPSTVVHPGRTIAQQITDQQAMLQRLILQEQQGDPTRLVQIAVFGIWDVGGGEQYRWNALTSAQVSTYNTWIKALASTLGKTRVMIWLEPDLAMLLNPAVKSIPTREAMTRGAAYTLSRNPNATIYLSAGDFDWPMNDPASIARLLTRTGIQYARGFGLGDTHYTDPGRNIERGAAMVKQLTSLGYPGRHYLIDTADTGRGFTFGEYASRWHKSAENANTQVCTSTITKVCNTLGNPPTWQVLDTRLPLTATQRYYAQRQLDAFVWVGRPWDNLEAWPFMKGYALALARSSPYA